MKNNIKEILDQHEMSINELSRLIEKGYKTTHVLVHREDLSSTPIGTLVKVAQALGVELKLLYGE